MEELKNIIKAHSFQCRIVKSLYEKNISEMKQFMAKTEQLFKSSSVKKQPWELIKNLIKIENSGISRNIDSNTRIIEALEEINQSLVGLSNHIDSTKDKNDIESKNSNKKIENQIDEIITKNIHNFITWACNDHIKQLNTTVHEIFAEVLDKIPESNSLILLKEINSVLNNNTIDNSTSFNKGNNNFPDAIIQDKVFDKNIDGICKKFEKINSQDVTENDHLGNFRKDKPKPPSVPRKIKIPLDIQKLFNVNESASSAPPESNKISITSMDSFHSIKQESSSVEIDNTPPPVMRRTLQITEQPPVPEPMIPRNNSALPVFSETSNEYAEIEISQFQDDKVPETVSPQSQPSNPQTPKSRISIFNPLRGIKSKEKSQKIKEIQKKSQSLSEFTSSAELRDIEEEILKKPEKKSGLKSSKTTVTASSSQVKDFDFKDKKKAQSGEKRISGLSKHGRNSIKISSNDLLNSIQTGVHKTESVSEEKPLRQVAPTPTSTPSKIRPKSVVPTVNSSFPNILESVTRTPEISLTENNDDYEVMNIDSSIKPSFGLQAAPVPISNKKLYRVEFSFTGDGESTMSVTKGQIVEVDDGYIDQNGWCLCSIQGSGGNSGYVPYNYLVEI